jgi:Kelch motif/Galactose oxidase, central domain
MSTPRFGAAAVALPGGDVLVAGGSSGGTSALNTAEVYHPAAGSFTPVANTMASSRLLPAAAPRPDGDVLVIGGQDQSGNSLSSADLYDPTTNTFLTGSQAPPNMSTGRALPLVATLDNGDVLVAGGAGANNVPLASAEVYNPTMNSWSATANSMSVPRLAGGIAPLVDGRELRSAVQAPASRTPSPRPPPTCIPPVRTVSRPGRRWPRRGCCSGSLHFRMGASWSPVA